MLAGEETLTTEASYGLLGIRPETIDSVPPATRDEMRAYGQDVVLSALGKRARRPVTSWDSSLERAAIVKAIEGAIIYRGFRPNGLDAQIIQAAIKAITAEGPGGSQALERVRQKRLKRDGGFGRRYVAVKWLDPSGQVAPLRERVPARDRIPEQMGRIIAGQPEKYPHGAASFFEQERPLLQARTGEFATVVGEQIRRELQPLGADSPTVAHAQLASFLDLSWTLHHQAHVRSAAHPAAKHPRSPPNPNRAAESDVIFRIASSSVSTRSSRT